MLKALVAPFAVVVASILVAFAVTRDFPPRPAPVAPVSTVRSRGVSGDVRPLDLSARRDEAAAWPPPDPDPVDGNERRPVRSLSLETLGGHGWAYHDTEVPAYRARLGEVWKKIRGEDGSAPEIWASFPDFEFERLTELFPESPTAKSFAEYAEIRGGRYFGYRWLYTPGDFKYDPEREIPGFLGWVARYPGHPGLDDACYRLGRCYTIRGDPAEALRWFERARVAPDGDMERAAECWANLLLDTLMSEDELLAYVYREGDARAAYSLGLSLFRGGDFEGALSWMDWAAFGLSGGTASLVRGHMEVVREIHALSAAVDRARGEEDLARALYALGRRQYHDGELYESVLWGDSPRAYRRYALRTSGLKRIWGHNGAPAPYKSEFQRFNSRLAARRTFLDLAERCPRSTLTAAARYSAATALLRTLGGAEFEDEVGCRARGRRQVAREYRRLARDFPRSRFADDALYHAGALSGQREAFEEIVILHPGGDHFKNALRELEAEGPPPPDLSRIPGLIADLAEGEDWRSRGRSIRAAREIERVLDVCALAVPDRIGEERRVAIREIEAWFRASQAMLEFDGDVGSYVLR